MAEGWTEDSRRKSACSASTSRREVAQRVSGGGREPRWNGRLDTWQLFTCECKGAIFHELHHDAHLTNRGLVRGSGENMIGRQPRAAPEPWDIAALCGLISAPRTRTT